MDKEKARSRGMKELKSSLLFGKVFKAQKQKREFGLRIQARKHIML